MTRLERRLTYVPPSSRCGHTKALAKALGRPQDEIDANWNLTAYWPALLAQVASLVPHATTGAPTDEDGVEELTDYMTSGGVVLTDGLLQHLADEAERGYDTNQIRPRRPGRT